MEELSKKEKRAAKKQAQRDAAKAAQKKQTMRSLAIWGGVLVAVVVAFWGLIQLGSPSIDLPTLTTTEIFETDHVKGNPDAAVTLIEYSDFQCPACAGAYPVVKELLDAYGEDMRFVYRHFPLTTIHPQAQIAAQASEAAANQGMFFEFHDVLFENQSQWGGIQAKRAFEDYAEQLGMDVDQFVADMNSRESREIVDNSASSAIRNNVSSTPTFFLNGQLIRVQNYQQLEAAIQQEIANAGGSDVSEDDQDMADEDNLDEEADEASEESDA